MEPWMIILAPILFLLGLVVYWIWKAGRDKKRFFAQLEQGVGTVKVKDGVYTITQGEQKIEARFKQGRRHARFPTRAS